jgi:hypothetical protein
MLDGLLSVYIAAFLQFLGCRLWNRYFRHSLEGSPAQGGRAMAIDEVEEFRPVGRGLDGLADGLRLILFP